MKKENVTNKKEGSTNWLSIIALVISIIAISYCLYCTFVMFPRNETLGFDYQGIIVATLAVAVTIFVAVQIYQSVTLLKDIEAKNKELREENTKNNETFSDEIKKELNKTLDDKIKSTNNYYEGTILFIEARTFTNDEQYLDAYYNYMGGLSCFIKSDIKVAGAVKGCINNMGICLDIIKQTPQKVENNRIIKDKRTKDIEQFLFVILKSESKYITNEQKKKLIELENKRKEIMRGNNIEEEPAPTKEEPTSPDKK